jgi:tRNA nucleotidyltransferase (CCA-adding enzyme)
MDRVAALAAAKPLLPRLAAVPGVYLVGGAVRDLLLDFTPRELDLVVEGDAAALARRLGQARVHDRFGTSTVTLNGFSYDIAGARTETYARPGGLPEVTPASLAEDLLRRDFTVNALALALGGDQRGELTMAPGAIEDLDARILRVLHVGSFVDDPTRLLRLARYAARLRFGIAPQTLELANSAVGSGALHTVSGARLGTELRLLAGEPDPVAAFTKLAELGLDAAIHEGFGLRDPSLARTALALLPEDGRRDLVVLAVAARATAPESLRELLDSLSFEAGDREVIIAAADRADTVARDLEQATSPSEIADVLRAAPSEVVAIAGALGPAEKARTWLKRLRHVRLAISGRDLEAAGIPEGPAIGLGLRAALAAKLDGLAAGREEELERAVRAAKGGA